MQTPLTHFCVLVQALAQVPQFLGLLWRDTQVEPHLVCPDGQGTATHPPFTQLSPVGQSLPQAPQFLASVLVLTHAPLQAVRPLKQAHLPLIQAPPVRQAVRHPPQFLASFWVLVQFPLQLVSPGLHVVCAASGAPSMIPVKLRATTKANPR